MREIITAGGLVAQVDDEDFARLSPHTWYTKRVHATWHAFRYLGKPAKSKRISMHHEVVGCEGGTLVYHQDGNGLNNQRSNLVAREEYQWRQRQKRKAEQPTSRYRGVAWVEQRKMWLAFINKDGKTVHLGLHPHEEDAARHYDRAASVQYGERAALNFPWENN
jgi:G3E family GTPase